MRKRMLFWLLGALCPLAWGNEPSAQYFNELDTRSHLLCASAMVYFNPNERSPEPGGLNTVFYHLNTLESRVQQLGKPGELVQPLQAIKRLFSELENTPASQRERYPTLIRQLLVEQRKLQQAAAAQASAISASTQAQELNAQSQALARLLLDYQLRRYPLPNKAEFTLEPAQLEALDGDIEQRFDSLLADPAAQTSVLRKASASYQFVRAELQRYRSGTQGGIEFYLSRVVLDLDELAMAEAEAQP
jgi:hypothetical protein